jgi:peptidoglycan hydrolase-like protein with peptidoglycan-binding domain
MVGRTLIRRLVSALIHPSSTRTVARSGPGSPGNETDFFGAKTFQALKKFQQAHGLPGTGYLGPLTRTVISQLP